MIKLLKNLLVRPTIVPDEAIRTVTVRERGRGFGHDFSKLDELIPYEIIKLGNKENPPRVINGVEHKTWNSQYLAVREKSTGKIIKNIDYNYHTYGLNAFAPFIWEGMWFAFVPKTYMRSEVINLETGEVIAETESEKHLDWCPVNYYVPCFYRDPEEHSFTSTRDGSIKTYHVQISDYEIVSEEKYAFEFKDFVYLNTAFMAGVFWGADYEWLVYKFDIREMIRTGKIPVPSKENYCFEFDYNSDAEIRQYIRMQGPESYDNASYNRFYYYNQGFTEKGFNKEVKSEE